MSPDERRAMVAASARRYRATPKGKATVAAYEATPERHARKTAYARAYYQAHKEEILAYHRARHKPLPKRI